MFEFDTEVSKIVQQTPSIKTFRMPAKGNAVDYESGQFFFISIDVDGKQGLHHFSFSSSPTEAGYIEFTKRITSSDFSQALARMKPGARAHIRGPEGGFVLPPTPSPLAFLSGGIGVTPLRSMLRYITDKKLTYDIVMLYGNASYEEIAFRQELDSIAAGNPRIRIEHVLSGPNLPPGWKGKVGLINATMIPDLIPDYKKRAFYISGPPKMVLSLQDHLTALGLPYEQIKLDSFTGYD